MEDTKDEGMGDITMFGGNEYCSDNRLFFGYHEYLVNKLSFHKKRVDENNIPGKIVKKIQEDLVTTFQRKGISISNIQIDISSNNLNVSVCIED